MPSILDLRKKYHNKIDPLDFDLILEETLKKPRAFILAHPEYKISASGGKTIESMIARRIKDEPLAYILGRKEFYGLDFKVDKNVLVPRPETELLLGGIIDTIKQKSKSAHGGSAMGGKIIFIDVGTGSGCIIIAIAKTISASSFQLPAPKFLGIDISPDALTVARKNARKHKVDNLIKFVKGDLLDPFMKISKPACRQAGSKLIVAANLPYVSTGWKKHLSSKDAAGLRFEPSIALYSGEDGLGHYRRLAGQLKRLRAATSQPVTVYCEIGHGQAGGMKKIFSFAEKIEIKKDHNRLRRLAIVHL